MGFSGNLKDLEKSLLNLLNRVKSGSYVAPPVNRSISIRIATVGTYHGATRDVKSKGSCHFRSSAFQVMATMNDE
jgi:hypothetical protein